MEVKTSKIDYIPKTKEELANLLDCKLGKLNYLLYALPTEKQYSTFLISKKSGGKREICAPISAIKTYQRRLLILLEQLYNNKSCVFGFVKGKDITQNAKIHRKRRWIVNIDLKDFFPSINFGRVRGAFLGIPFNFSEEVATLIAQICCFEGKLPQGAPTSPFVSNIIAHQLDKKLIELARKNKLYYTRYADDITFSSYIKNIPEDIGNFNENKQFILGENLTQLINNSGFIINNQKVHCRFYFQRQIVTGLVTNVKVNVPRSYIKKTRCMLHAYERFGLKNASSEHFNKYSQTNKLFKEVSFRRMLIGRIGYIGHVRGKDDDVYKKLVYRLKSIDPTVPLNIPVFTGDEKIVVYGEGKTDWMHLERALYDFREKGKFLSLGVAFYHYNQEDHVNNDTLYNLCKTRRLLKKDNKLEIFLFDRDVKSFLTNVVSDNGEPKDWGNNIFSMALPKVSHRNFDEVCIEHYYVDDDLLKTDDKERRIFLSNEFNEKTRNHKKDTKLIYANANKIKSPYPIIIDKDVLNESGKNVALSKMAFARNVFYKKGNFAKMDFSAFENIYIEIEKIYKMQSIDIN